MSHIDLSFNLYVLQYLRPRRLTGDRGNGRSVSQVCGEVTQLEGGATSRALCLIYRCMEEEGKVSLH